ncbi:MAG: DUF541 domain-containing protein, partial [Chloroflexi bacterium]|nr:DUF541 domain-containing protein [Chloroflexota bacterium]
MNIKHVTRSLLALGATAVVALTVACTPTTQVHLPSAENPAGITVTGEGKVTVRPDIALVNVGVEVTAPTVAEARAAAAEAMQLLQDAVKANGVVESDIRTQYFNIYPQYVYRENDAPRITGFTVNNQVEVKVRDIDSASEVLDAAIAAGGDSVRVNGISFTVENPEGHLAEARKTAVENARERAEVLADAAGVSLGAARSISESTGGGDYPIPMRDSMAGGGPTALNA